MEYKQIKVIKLILLLVFGCLLTGYILCFGNMPAFAATSTTNKYEVSLSQFELKNDTQWVTVSGAASVVLDIAFASGTNQRVGNFFSGLSVPDGTYTATRATPSTSFVINGSVAADNGNTYYTTAETTSDGNGRTVSVGRQNITAADCTVTVLSSDISPGDGVTFSGGSLVVTNGKPSHKVKVYFNLSNALTAVPIGDGTTAAIYPGPPTVTITLE